MGCQYPNDGAGLEKNQSFDPNTSKNAIPQSKKKTEELEFPLLISKNFLLENAQNQYDRHFQRYWVGLGWIVLHSQKKIDHFFKELLLFLTHRRCSAAICPTPPCHRRRCGQRFSASAVREPPTGSSSVWQLCFESGGKNGRGG